MERKGILIDLSPSFFQFLPFFLYAETHFRYRFLFSWLEKKEPEIIADAPHRLEPGLPLPILLIVKDADRYPIRLEAVHARIYKNGRILCEMELLDSPIHFDKKLSWNTFSFALADVHGMIECDISMRIHNGKKNCTYHNDNHRTSSRRPLRICISTSPLPRFESLHFGECHSHTSYTDDQVEFGAPIDPAALLARSQGLTFYCATDHSYDLDDSTENYLIHDPQLPKWNNFQKEVDTFNSQNKDFVVIRGEEVSCRNSRDQNVHMLLLGTKTFFYGSGDGAEQWPQTYSEQTVDDILQAVKPPVVSFAAHPREHVPFLQRLLLRRGRWSRQDMNHPQLTGIQLMNGSVSPDFWEGYRCWIEALLEGKKMRIIAGNDAHGNFNRFRQVSIPFVKIRESENQLFGKIKTGVFTRFLQESSVLQALSDGNAVITDGPVINLTLKGDDDRLTSLGGEYTANSSTISLEAKSTTDFGSISSVIVFMGIIGQGEEKIVSQSVNSVINFTHEFSLQVKHSCYIRAELWTSASDSVDQSAHFCYTNPIWINPNKN